MKYQFYRKEFLIYLHIFLRLSKNEYHLYRLFILILEIKVLLGFFIFF